jgi:CTP synthase (UTP-ammonia lyase)
MTVRIGVVGDFSSDFAPHVTTNESLSHSATYIGTEIDVVWLPTPSLLDDGEVASLASFDALWISAGSPYRSRDGVFAAIRYARERGRPMIAT